MSYYFIRNLLVLLPLLCGANNLWAISWEIKPSAGLVVSYTDNVYLTNEEEDDFVYRLTPGIRFTGKGNRLTLDFDYKLNIVGFTENSRGDESTNTLLAKANFAFIKNLLFLDLSAIIDQRVIEMSDPMDQQQLSITNNYSEAMETSVAPYIDTLLGKKMRLLLRYTYSTLSYDVSALGEYENETRSVKATLSSLSRERLSTLPSGRLSRIPSGRLNWAIEYTGRDIDYHYSVADARLEQFKGTLSISPFRDWKIITFAGYERNDYEPGAISKDSEGDFYGLGFEWRLEKATRLKVVGRDGYSGKSATVVFEHDSGKTRYLIDYAEEYKTYNLDEYNEDNRLPDQNAGIVSLGAFLEKRAFFRVNRRFTRSDLTFGIRNTGREYQHDGTEERTVSTVLQWNRRLSRRMKILLEGSWSKVELPSSSDRDFEQPKASVELKYKLGRRTTGTLGYEYTHKETSDPDSEYKRNLLTAGIRLKF